MPSTLIPAPRGRFAPTPSGPLHLGSLYTALASYLDVKSRGGEWWLRIDDLDAARCDADAEAEIRAQLRHHALAWDGEPRRQSDHLPDYAAALRTLTADGHTFACDCSRRALRQTAPDGPDGPVYPGTCRDRGLEPGDAAIRFRVGERALVLEDRLQGPLRREPRRDIGDFIVQRRDGPIAYQLASVVDDLALGITEVWRGHDLVGSSLRQWTLFEAFAATPPRFAHAPILCDAGGKLSKQHHAVPIESAQAADNLRRCLAMLGQPAPPADRDSPARLVDWAVEHWCADSVPREALIDLGPD